MDKEVKINVRDADEPGEGDNSGPLPETHPLTPDEIERLKEEASKAQEYWQQLLRTAADFDNYKKRAAREKSEATKYALEGLLEKLVPVLDNFEMAMAAAQSAQDGPVDALQTGVNMIYQQLRTALTDAGLQEVNATNQKFDPTVHEAISQQETAEVPEGNVVQQMRKGYKLHERLIRPASVVVAKTPSQDKK